jgi:16S rRNA (adenine1518-N6/adenine1519-N6)-dimethyltransferase
VSTTSTGSSSPRSRTAAGPFDVPATPDAIRETLGAIGLRPSRKYGQSFLSDPFVADAEAALLEVPPDAPVVEIGGGLGLLTAAVLRRHPGPLAVIERDPRLAAHLRRTFGARIRLLEADALTVDLPPAAAVVGNLPYSVATPILLRLFEARVPRIVFLVQREVAERLGASPRSKTYGRLSIIARLYGEVELFRPVPPEAFTPRPEVSSRVGVHRARPGRLPVPSVPDFERMVQRLFAGRRKQLGNLLPALAGGDEEAGRTAQRAGWPSDWMQRRPEELPPEAFFALATAFSARR